MTEKSDKDKSTRKKRDRGYDRMKGIKRRKIRERRRIKDGGRIRVDTSEKGASKQERIEIKKARK